jgi:hypothetical protein
MENNIAGTAKPERIMWFSMWFLASIVTFGLAFFPLFYRSVERRNLHFRRQREMEKQVETVLQSKGEEPAGDRNLPPERNAALWAASIVLVVPAFAAMYVLSRDLVLHEKHQQEFLKKALSDENYKPQHVPLSLYLVITVATLGLGGIYWLYKVLNIYNNHFKEHRMIDNDLDRLIEGKSHGESL